MVGELGVLCDCGLFEEVEGGVGFVGVVIGVLC